jgi:ABC-type transporter Mla subunit MlaD
MNKFPKETASGIFVIIGLACILYMSLNFGNISIFSDGSYTILADFKSVSGLQAGNRVELLGIKVGRVGGYSIDEKRHVAVVSLKIFGSVKIHNDAVAVLETDGLLGDKYVNIQSDGNGIILKPGDAILTASSSFGELAHTLKELPIHEISAKLLSTLTGMDRLVNLPILEEGLVNINETIKDIKEFVRHADEGIERLMAGFENAENNLQTVLGNIDNKIEPMAKDFKAVAVAARQTLKQAERALSLKDEKVAAVASSIKKSADAIKEAARSANRTFVQAEKTLSNIDAITADDSMEIYQIRNTLKELTAAARAIKNWAEYLERHPEAIIRGKGTAYRR